MVVNKDFVLKKRGKNVKNEELDKKRIKDILYRFNNLIYFYMIDI